MVHIIIVKQLFLLLILGISAVTDLLYRRIYNRVLFSGAVLFAALGFLCGPGIEALPLAYLLSFITVVFIMFKMHLAGGGDVKLYMLTALACPGSSGLGIAVLSVFIAGFAAVILFFIKGNIDKKLSIPMAVCIFTAALIIIVIPFLPGH